MSPLIEFDEDRPSITGRKVSSNIPPAIAGSEKSRLYLKWVLAVLLFPALLMVILALLR